jgi:hypothetical protein
VNGLMGWVVVRAVIGLKESVVEVSTLQRNSSTCVQGYLAIYNSVTSSGSGCGLGYSPIRAASIRKPRFLIEALAPTL